MSLLFTKFDNCFDRFCYLHSWYKTCKDTAVNIIVCPVNGMVQEPNGFSKKPVVIGDNEISWHFYVMGDYRYYFETNDALMTILKKNSILLANFYYSPPTHYADMNDKGADIMKRHSWQRQIAINSAVDVLVEMNKQNLSIPKFADYIEKYEDDNIFSEN